MIAFYCLAPFLLPFSSSEPRRWNIFDNILLRHDSEQGEQKGREDVQISNVEVYVIDQNLQHHCYK